MSVQEGVSRHIFEEKKELQIEELKKIMLEEMNRRKQVEKKRAEDGKRRVEEEKKRAEEGKKKAEEEKKKAEEEKRRRHRQHEQRLANNLDTLMRETGNNISSIPTPTRSPVGSYDVYCEELEGQWKEHDFIIDVEKNGYTWAFRSFL